MPRIQGAPKTSFAKLRSMECFDEVHQKIIDGWKIAEIARWMQEEKEEYTDVTRDSLTLILQNYRKSLPPGELVSKRIPDAIHKAAEQLAEGMDELQELEKLYRFQMQRVQMGHAKEKLINLPIPSMTQEVRVAAEILGRYAELKMDLGINERQLGTVDVVQTKISEASDRYGKPGVQKVLENAESRRRVLGLAERFLQLAPKKAEEEPK